MRTIIKAKEMFPDKKTVRKIGFQREQEGIMNRFYREGERWNIHLRNTRQFILDSFREGGIRSIGIMGSGWLLDVPLQELADRFDRVLLLDIRHPVEVKHRVKNMPNVTLQETDLTGGAVAYCYEVKKRLKRKEKVSLGEGMILDKPAPVMETDALVSLNLLNQLNGILLDFLQADKYFQQTETDSFSKKIQDFHMQWITRKPGCIITEVAEHNTDHKGIETVKLLPHIKLPEGKRKASWTWEFDTEETYHENYRTTMEIQAVEW